MARNLFNYPVYNYAVGWFNRRPADVIDLLAPALPVDGITGTIKRYPQGYAFRHVDTSRPLYGEARILDMGAEDIPFLLEDHSLRIGVDDSELAPGAGANQAAKDQVAISKSETLLTAWQTSKVVDALAHFRKAIPATAGVGAWSGVSSDPIAELKTLVQNFREANGLNPNRLVMSDAAWNILGANASVLDRVTFNAAKMLTKDLLLTLLELPQETIVSSVTVPVGSTAPGYGVDFVGSNAMGSDCWLSYAGNAGVGDMSGLRMLHQGSESPVENVESYYQRERKTTWYELGMHRAPIVTAPSCVNRITVS